MGLNTRFIICTYAESAYKCIFIHFLLSNKTTSFEMKIQIISVFIFYIGCKYADAINCYSCHSIYDDFCGDADALVAKGNEAIWDCPKTPVLADQCYYSRVATKGSDVVDYNRGCTGN